MLQLTQTGSTGCAHRMRYAAWGPSARASSTGRPNIGCQRRPRSKTQRIYWVMSPAMGHAAFLLWLAGSNVSIPSKHRGALLRLCLGMLAIIQRQRVRRSYHLSGDLGSDCLKSFCCYCCVVAQNEREVRDREDSIRRNAGPASAAYIAPGTMIYAPPPR